MDKISKVRIEAIKTLKVKIRLLEEENEAFRKIWNDLLKALAKFSKGINKMRVGE